MDTKIMLERAYRTSELARVLVSTRFTRKIVVRGQHDGAWLTMPLRTLRGQGPARRSQFLQSLAPARPW